MIRLIKVELNRLRWRRAIVVLLAAAIVVPVVIFIAVAYETRPVSEAERAEVAETVREETQAPYVQRQLRHCERSPEEFGVGAEDGPETCEDAVLPRPEWYLTRAPLNLAEEVDEGAGIGVAAVLTVLMLLIGTTFVGHDWNTGSMGNQLLFESRRPRVWVAKALAVLGAALVVSGLVLFSYWGGLLALAHQRDIPVPDGIVNDVYAQALRGTVLAGLAGLGGYLLTMLFRSTVATLGILFAVAVAVPVLFSLFTFPGHISLQPQYNGWAWIVGGVEITDYDDEKCWDNPAGTEGCIIEITTAESSVYLGSVLAAAGIPSLLLYRRRDVP